MLLSIKKYSLSIIALIFCLGFTSIAMAKEPIKTSKLELKYGFVDLSQHTLTIKISYIDVPTKFYDHIFEKYVPRDYFLEYYLGFDSYVLIYRDEAGKTTEIVSPGRMGKDVWEKGEEAIYALVKTELKPFKVRSAIGEHDIN